MKNVRLEIEYDGTEFHGWQRQANHQPTIQAVIEDNLAVVLGRRVVLYGASRTDSGVHARGQVANFYVSSRISAEQWKHVLNFYLPRTIRIVDSREVPLSFHAQKDAIEKIYEFRVLNRDIASALDRRVYFYPGALDWERMRAALPFFVGTHDFRAFQGAKATVVSTVRTLHQFELREESAGLYCFRLLGTGFLKQMVRTIMGTVIEVGEGKREPGGMAEILSSRDRQKAGRTLPASGLCLVQIRYPEYSPWRGKPS